MTSIPAPDIVVLHNDVWERFVEEYTEAAYEAYDNTLDTMHLDGIVDVVAGAFYWSPTHTVYCSLRIWDGAEAGVAYCIALLNHEFGHGMNWPKENHPTGLRNGVLHAASCGFDVRAYTRWLRWRKGDPTRWAQAEEWRTKTLPTFSTVPPVLSPGGRPA